MMLARRAGVRVLLDCDGAWFKDAVRARPFLVKPNEHELEGFFGRRIRNEKALRRSALLLSQTTGGWVLLSRGGAGAMLVHAGLDVHLGARVPRGKALNTVGAGDAMLAAVAAQIGAGVQASDWLRAGIAAGTALTRCEAGILPGKALIRRIAKTIEI
jgi:1-phosphofructokinase